MSKKSDRPVVFSALEVANICGVVNQTAINWIQNGHLKAFKTPGGQFRVYPDDLKAFMESRNMRIPDEFFQKLPYAVKKYILVVDDDKGLNGVISEYIASKISGIEVRQAFDGFEAGVSMTENHPVCVILDLDLPGVDGLSLCRRIFGSEVFGKPQVIIITGLEDPSVEQNVRELGIKYFLKKPVRLPELAEAVCDVLNLPSGKKQS